MLSINLALTLTLKFFTLISLTLTLTLTLALTLEKALQSERNVGFLNANKVSAKPRLLSAITPTPQRRKDDVSL